MITIEQASIADAALIGRLGEKSFIESHGHSASPADIGSYVRTKFTLHALEDELNDCHNIFHVIYYRGLAAGFSKIIFNSPHPLIESKAVTKLERLYLLKEFYGLGIGPALFTFVTDLSKKENQEGIWLYVWKENTRAVNFYKKSGFEIIGSGDFKISETHANPNHIMYLKY